MFVEGGRGYFLDMKLRNQYRRPPYPIYLIDIY